MNEDIKRLREAAQAILDNRKNHPGPRGFDQAIDRFQMAAQPELLLRLLDDAERYQWRPMSTAPKDGTNVLLINRAGNMGAGLWLSGILGVGWFLRGGNKPDVFFNDHYGPTHWMPLPSAPKDVS
jgi:hypothetical protein